MKKIIGLHLALTSLTTLTAFTAILLCGSFYFQDTAFAQAPDTTPPSDVEELTAEPIYGKEGSVKLTWSPATDNVGVETYEIHYGLYSIWEDGFYEYQAVEYAPSTETSFTVTDLMFGYQYYFAVIAKDAAGNQGAYFSPEASAVPRVSYYIDNLLVTMSANYDGMVMISSLGVYLGNNLVLFPVVYDNGMPLYFCAIQDTSRINDADADGDVEEENICVAIDENNFKLVSKQNFFGWGVYRFALPKGMKFDHLRPAVFSSNTLDDEAGDVLHVVNFSNDPLNFELRNITGLGHLANPLHKEWPNNNRWFYTVGGGELGDYNIGPVFNNAGEFVGMSDVFMNAEVTDLQYGYVWAHGAAATFFKNLAQKGLISEDYVIDKNPQNIDWMNVFSDVSSKHWRAPAIAFLRSADIFKGYEDGTFKPDDAINRAELLTVLVKAYLLLNEDVYTANDVAAKINDNAYKNCFPDVKEEWFAKYICFASSKGWVKGYDDGTFRPGNNTARAEALKMMFEVFNEDITPHAAYSPNVADYFIDIPNEDKDKWYAANIFYAKRLGILEEGNTRSGKRPQAIIDKSPYFRPAENITRSEFAVMLHQLIAYHIQEIAGNFRKYEQD